MAQEIQRLSALAVTRASKPGLYADGAGLYLRVGRNGSKSWAFRFTLRGKPREMGLGGLSKVTLADARKKAADARLLLSDGRDPLDLRQEEEAKRVTEEKLAAARSITFDKCAEAYIAAQDPSWRNEKHKQQWRNTIKSYVTPVFANTPVQDIDLDLVMKVIEPMWTKKTETARRIRGRIEVILDWARVRGYRSGENPARWRGQMDQLLPARSKLNSVKHHPALPYSDIPDFMKVLRAIPGNSAAALEGAKCGFRFGSEADIPAVRGHVRSSPQQPTFGCRAISVVKGQTRTPLRLIDRAAFSQSSGHEFLSLR
jgi:hypothetical protein